MRILRKRNGQSIAEYAVLIGLVLGAVLAMQHYIRKRIAGAIKAQADNYATNAQWDASIDLAGRTTNSVTDANMAMSSSADGTVTINSQGNSVIQGIE